MSSVRVSCSQPPASSMAWRRQIPAVPLKFMNRLFQARAGCSTTKWPSMPIAWARVTMDASGFRCPQRAWTRPTSSRSSRTGTVRIRKSRGGTKSASKMAKHSASERRMP